MIFQKNYAARPMSFTSRNELTGSLSNIIVDRLTKPPLNIHSCCNLVCTDANSSGVRATNSSPYTVRDAKVLLCQGRVAVTTGSSFGCGLTIIPPRIEGLSLDIRERFTKFVDWEEGRFIPVHLMFRPMGMEWVLYASLSETRLNIAVGLKTSGEPSSSQIFFGIGIWTTGSFNQN